MNKYKGIYILLIVLSFFIPSFVFAKYPATWKEATGEDPWVAEQRMRVKNVQLYVDVANKVYSRMLEAYRSSDPDFHLLGGIYLSNNSCDYMFSGGGSPEMSLADRQCAKLLTPTEYKDIYGVDLYSTNWWKEDRTNLALGGVPYRTVVGTGHVGITDGDIFEQMLSRGGRAEWPLGPKLGNAYDPNLKLPIPAPTWEEYQKYGDMTSSYLPMWAARFGWPYVAPPATLPAPTTQNQNNPTTNNNPPSNTITNPTVTQIKPIGQAGTKRSGCFKSPDGSVRAQGLATNAGQYCIYLVKATPEQRNKDKEQMRNILAKYPNWNKCAVNITELRNVTKKLGFFGGLFWQPPRSSSANYELYQKCADAISVLQYINENRFEIHPAVWLYETGFWIGISKTGPVSWPPKRCDSCPS